MSSASHVQARRQSILVHVRKAQKTTESQNQSAWKGAAQSEVNAWFIIRDTAAGPKMSEIFCNLPENMAEHSLAGTGSVFVGSHLYDIGGRGSKPKGEEYFSNQIRHLDTSSPSGGWKSEELPAYCPDPTTVVLGEYIYLFPKSEWFTRVEGLENAAANPVSLGPQPWAYMYDTIHKKAFELNLPDGCIHTHVSFCASLEGHGVLVPIKEEKWHKEVLYLHKPTDMTWEESDSPPFHKFCNGNCYVVLDGILYVYCPINEDLGILEIYNMKTWESRRTIKLPKFDNMERRYHDWNTFIVPVTNSEFCFLWHKRPYWYKDLYYAKVSIDSFAGTATLLNQAVLRIDALEVINCLPYSPLLDDGNEGEEYSEIAATTSKKGKQQEINNFKYLDEELEWAAKEIQEVHERMKQSFSILPQGLFSEAGSSWKRKLNGELRKGVCIYIKEELDWIEEKVVRVQKRLKEAYSTLRPEIPPHFGDAEHQSQGCHRKKRKRQDEEDEFCNRRLQQYALLFENLMSYFLRISQQLQSRKAFTHPPSHV